MDMIRHARTCVGAEVESHVHRARGDSATKTHDALAKKIHERRILGAVEIGEIGDVLSRGDEQMRRRERKPIQRDERVLLHDEHEVLAIVGGGARMTTEKATRLLRLAGDVGEAPRSPERSRHRGRTIPLLRAVARSSFGALALGFSIFGAFAATFALLEGDARAAESALVYCGKSGCPGEGKFEALEGALVAEGAAALDVRFNDELTSLSQYKLIFVMAPAAALGADDTAALLDFKAAGGALVLVAETDAVAGMSTDTIADLLPALGVSSITIAGADLGGGGDCSAGTAMITNAAHPLVAGIGGLAISRASRVSGGVVAAVGGEGVLAVDDAAKVVVAGDSNLFDETCATFAETTNVRLFRNLWKWAQVAPVVDAGVTDAGAPASDASTPPPPPAPPAASDDGGCSATATPPSTASGFVAAIGLVACARLRRRRPRG